ncbi:hypothetical protein ACQY1F_10625 [Agrobacterium vitis]|uniref:hypothetical protein n=1 Tax=Agrobacterium vitis TaxID=373 RepID=UPI003D28EDA3
MKLLLRFISVILLSLLVLAALVATGWIALALWYRIPGPEYVRGAAAWALAGICTRHHLVRPKVTARIGRPFCAELGRRRYLVALDQTES